MSVGGHDGAKETKLGRGLASARSQFSFLRAQLERIKGWQSTDAMDQRKTGITNANSSLSAERLGTTTSVEVGNGAAAVRIRGTHEEPLNERRRDDTFIREESVLEPQEERGSGATFVEVRSADSPRFLGERDGSLKNKNDVLRYRLPESRMCLVYLFKRKGLNHEIYVCRECKKLGLHSPIKVIGDEFLSDPCQETHRCNTINIYSDKIARTMHKKCMATRQDRRYCRLSNTEIIEDMLQEIQRGSGTSEEKEEMMAYFHDGRLDRRRRTIAKNKAFHKDRELSWNTVPDTFAYLDDGTPFLQRKTASVQLYYSRITVEKAYRAGLHTLVADGVHNVLPVDLGDNTQLYTIHGVLANGHEVPLVHALTTNKTEATYEVIFRQLGQELAALNNNNVPTIRLVVDYEKAAINAARKAIPGITVEGCAFHLAQAWNRKRDKVGLRRYLVGASRERAVMSWWRTIKGLPFLPIHLRGRVPGTYRPSIPTSHEAYGKCEEFLNYLRARWLTGPFANLWCKWGTREYRTTNAAEAYHSKLRRILKARNVGLDVLLERVKAADTRAMAELCVLERVPERERALRRRDRERRRRIDNEMQRFTELLIRPCPRTVHINTYCKRMARFVSDKTI